MVRKESPISIEQPKQPEYFQDILKFSDRPPATGKEIKNCRKLFKSGVIGVFAKVSDGIDSRLKIYFTDDFSKICLGKKEETGRREALVSVGIESKLNGNVDMAIGIRNKGKIKMLHFPEGENGLITLNGILIGNIVSLGYKYNELKPMKMVDHVEPRVNLPEMEKL